MQIRTWGDAEQVAETWMRGHGWPDARRTGAGADGGVDVESSLAVAQVKAWARPTPLAPVQRLYGVASSRNIEPLFFSLGGYTVHAISWADDVAMAMWTLDPAGRVLPATEVAEALTGQPPLVAHDEPAPDAHLPRRGPRPARRDPTPTDTHGQARVAAPARPHAPMAAPALREALGRKQVWVTGRATVDAVGQLLGPDTIVSASRARLHARLQWRDMGLAVLTPTRLLFGGLPTGDPRTVPVTWWRRDALRAVADAQRWWSAAHRVAFTGPDGEAVTLTLTGGGNSDPSHFVAHLVAGG